MCVLGIFFQLSTHESGFLHLLFYIFFHKMNTKGMVMMICCVPVVQFQTCKVLAISFSSACPIMHT